MAFDADCGSLTVLEALLVASASRFPMPVECWAPVTCVPRDEALRDSATPTGASRRRL